MSTFRPMWSIPNTTANATPADQQHARESLQRLLERKDIGFFKAQDRKQELSGIKALAEKKRSKFSHIAILGIGGSALGTLALFEALLPDWIEDKRILFFDNVDSRAFYRKLESIQNPQDTLWVIISKSGSTVETLTQAECIDAFLKSKGMSGIAKNAVAITEKKSSDLYDWAEKNQVDMLAVPVDVGGRFSVLTAVGLFPAAFAGISIEKIWQGAEQALEQKSMTEKLLAEYVFSARENAHAAYFFSYCDDLKNFGAWMEQLWAESLGKKQALDGGPAPLAPIPIACRGATDQHSVLQQVAHGRERKIVTFFRVGKAEAGQFPLSGSQFKATQVLQGKSIGELLRAEAVATEQALGEENIQTLSLFTETLEELSMGFLFMTYEVLVGSLGTYLKIDPFDQPGVERGKILARNLLSQK